MFNTPVKNGKTKMTWNSPFQPLQPINQSSNVKFDNSQGFDDLNFTGSIIDFSALNSENGLASNQNVMLLQQQQPAIFNTDIPALDDLFSELNSNIDEESKDFGIKSEPVNFEDIERILLPQSNIRKSKLKRLVYQFKISLCSKTAV